MVNEEMIIQILQDVSQSINNLSSKTDKLSDRVDELSVRTDGMSDKIVSLQKGQDELSNKVTDIMIHLENETDRNIQLLLEQHNPIVDKLDKTNAKIEVLEFDVGNIKRVVMSHSKDINFLMNNK